MQSYRQRLEDINTQLNIVAVNIDYRQRYTKIGDELQDERFNGIPTLRILPLCNSLRQLICQYQQLQIVIIQDNHYVKVIVSHINQQSTPHLVSKLQYDINELMDLPYRNVHYQFQLVLDDQIHSQTGLHKIYGDSEWKLHKFRILNTSINLECLIKVDE